MSSFPHIHIEIHGNAYQYFFTQQNIAGEAAHSDDLGEIVRVKPEITFNDKRTTRNGKKAPDGIEIRFGNTKPVETVRQELKDHGFQFSEKQTMWYAYDNDTSRQLVERWMNTDVEVDNTRYVKQHFWARVRSEEDYRQLRDYTEFYIKVEPPAYYNGKRALENSHHPIYAMMRQGLVYFKKHYNRPIDDEQGSTDNYDSQAIAKRLKDLADGMEKAIEGKINSATSKQRPTARRMRIAASMRAEGRAMQETQTTLYALSDAHNTGKVLEFPFLQNIRTKRQAEVIIRYGTYTKNGWNISTGFNNNQEELAKLGIDSLEDWQEASRQHDLLLLNHSDTAAGEERKKQEKIKQLEEHVFSENIPGFFPTPSDLIEWMLDIAEVKETHTVLDPSAGKGDILDAVARRLSGNKLNLHAIEINSSLRQILELKDYTIWDNDFLQVEPEGAEFDRIIMNPPFENGQDVDHVTHALKFLHPTGRLVAIVSEGPFFREFKKDKAFRLLLQQHNAFISEPIKEAFKTAFKSTGVNVRIIAINGSAKPIPSSNMHTSSDNSNSEHTEENDLDLLQLEAEAELELLKMRVEMERKRQQKPLQGIDSNKLQLYRKKALELQMDASVMDFK